MLNKIPVSALRDVYKAMDKECVVEWNGIEIVIKKNVTMEEATAIVFNVVEACYTEDGQYMPVAKSFSFDLNVVEFFTNMTVPKNTKEAYLVLNATRLADLVWEYADSKQLMDIYDTIEDRVAYLNAGSYMEFKQQMQKMADMSEALTESMSAFASKMEDGTMEKILDMAERLDGKSVDEAATGAYLQLLRGERE